jgi:hypothetical protein
MYIIAGSEQSSLLIFLWWFCRGCSPLPIPNREVKPLMADGTAPQCGRVGSCHIHWSPVTYTDRAFFMPLTCYYDHFFACLDPGPFFAHFTITIGLKSSLISTWTNDNVERFDMNQGWIQTTLKIRKIGRSTYYINYQLMEILTG